MGEDDTSFVTDVDKDLDNSDNCGWCLPRESTDAVFFAHMLQNYVIFGCGGSWKLELSQVRIF